MNAIDIAFERFKAEEGIRKFAYDDSTGKTVSCRPGGNLSIGMGINLEAGLDDEEIEWFTRHRLQKTANTIGGFEWFQSCNPARQSVLLDIAFNAGTTGLLKFHDMLIAIGAEDWSEAQRQCHMVNPQLAGRYKKLGEVLLTGVA